MSARLNLARTTALVAIALTSPLTLTVASAGFLAPEFPALAPAYVSDSGLKIKPAGTTKPKQYVGHITLIKREIGSSFTGNAATGGWTGFAIYDLTADVSPDDGVTFFPATALDIPVAFEYLPVTPPTPPNTLEATVTARIQKVIILLTDGLESARFRQPPSLFAHGRLFTSSQGPYQITSDLDFEVELSLDRGQTWIPAEAPLSFTAIPEPTALTTLLPAIALLRRNRR